MHTETHGLKKIVYGFNQKIIQDVLGIHSYQRGSAANSGVLSLILKIKNKISVYAVSLCENLFLSKNG